MRADLPATALDPHLERYRPFLDPIRTTSAARPRRRRRLSVARPALVLMRARKPCLLIRFRFRGLYVGFMVSTVPVLEAGRAHCTRPKSLTAM